MPSPTINAQTDADKYIEFIIGTNCTLSANSFKSCTKMINVDLANIQGNTIPTYCFYDTAIKDIFIPNGIGTLGNYAFATCSNLVSFDCPFSSTSSETLEIGDYCFWLCTSLAIVTLKNRTTTIGEYAFSNCLALTDIFFPSTVTTIGDKAFESTRITQLDIPSNVTSIGSGTFSYCSRLSTLSFPYKATAITIGSSAFGSVSIANLIITSATQTQAETLRDSLLTKGLTLYTNYNLLY
jgi:hypothetical protein